MPISSVALVEHINGPAKNAFYFALRRCELKLVKVGMVNFSILMQIQNIPIIALPWTLLLVIHWQLVILLVIEQKFMILVVVFGLMLQVIHSILRTFFHYFFEQSIQNAILTSFRISAYATVTTGEGAIIIGGYNGKESVTTIADYTGNASGWTQLGDLHVARNGHRAIINVDQVFVVGGHLDDM